MLIFPAPRPSSAGNAGKFVLHKRSCKYASLVAIEPAQPGGDKLVFECTECGREEFMRLTFREERIVG